MRSRILVGLLVGTLGGFLGWLLQENLINYNAHVMQGILPGQGAVRQGLAEAEVRTLVLCVGGLIGLFLGTVDGIVEGNTRKLVRGLAGGALFGVLLGYVGLYAGTLVYNLLGGSDTLGRVDIFSFLRQVLARAFGWALMGLGLGVGAALPSMSKKRILHGAIGGLLGGFLGGFIFDILAVGTNPLQAAVGASGPRDVGGPSRMVGFTAIGGLAGFFIGLVDELFKQAWVKVLAGKNEGKDFILSKAMSILGRDERCDVPLYGDPSVGVQHAAIRTDGHRHVLLDGSTPTGTVVNGQRVPVGGELLLRDGDMIQIGTQRILFREKATANRYARAPIDAPKGKSPISATPMPGHLCPYCGGTKDPAGNCLCTIGGAPTGVVSNPNPAPGYSVPTTGLAPGNYSAGDYPGANPATQMMPGTAAATLSGMSSPRLIGLEGPYNGQMFPLAGPNLSVGREPERELVLTADSTVSRMHARLTLEAGGYVVYDNNSSNGTFVNGMRVTARPLVPGDIVQFGASKFRYE